jgi:hypothetical protein
MKFYRLIFIAITTLVAVAAAMMAVIYFKDEIVAFFGDLKDRVSCCKKSYFQNDEYTAYADL